MCDPADNPASENASVLSDHAIAVQHFKDPSRYRADYGAPFSILFVACMLVPSVVILLLGARYGTRDAHTGKSPTHEEFEEAQQTGRDVLVFVQDGVQRDDDQEAFVAEVRQWSTGASAGRSDDERSRIRGKIPRPQH